MNPRLYKHRITFLQTVGTTDELGQVEESDPMEYKTMWAAIKTMQGKEYFAAAATQNENTVRFIIRYTSGINYEMQIRFKDRVFDIISIINDDEANKTLTIIAKEGGQDGS